MRRVRMSPAVCVAVLWALPAWAMASRHAGVGLSADRGRVDLGRLLPSGGPVVHERACCISVTCADAWRLVMVGVEDFSTVGLPRETANLGLLACRRAGDARFGQLRPSRPIVVAAGAGRGTGVSRVWLDFTLRLPYSVKPGAYSARLVFEPARDGPDAGWAPGMEGSVDVGFEVAPCMSLTVMSGAIDFGEIKANCLSSPEMSRLLSEALGKGHASLEEVSAAAGPVAEEVLEKAWRGRIHSNTPWRLDVWLDRPLREQTTAGRRPRRLAGPRIRARAGGGVFEPLGVGEPCTVAVGPPTGDRGTIVSLDLALSVYLADPAGTFNGALRAGLYEPTN